MGGRPTPRPAATKPDLPVASRKETCAPGRAPLRKRFLVDQVGHPSMIRGMLGSSRSESRRSAACATSSRLLVVDPAAGSARDGDAPMQQCCRRSCPARNPSPHGSRQSDSASHDALAPFGLHAERGLGQIAAASDRVRNIEHVDPRTILVPYVLSSRRAQVGWRDRDRGRRCRNQPVGAPEVRAEYCFGCAEDLALSVCISVLSPAPSPDRRAGASVMRRSDLLPPWGAHLEISSGISSAFFMSSNQAVKDRLDQRRSFSLRPLRAKAGLEW